jgi:hypothetical protein
MPRAKAEPLPQGFSRGSQPEIQLLEPRALLFSRVPERTRWMENELARSGTLSTTARSVAQVVELLVGGNAPAMTLAIIDLDALDGGELFHLHRIREYGWGGTLVTLGKVPMSLRSSLGIDRTVAPPYVEDVLCDEVQQHVQDSQASTMPIPLPFS